MPIADRCIYRDSALGGHCGYEARPLLCRSVFFISVLLTVFWFAATMAQEKPAGVSVLDKYRERAAARKGRQSIDVIPSTAHGAGRGEAGPSHKSKKRPRDGGNIATTHRSPGSLPTPPPRREAAEAVPLSPRRVEQASGHQAVGHRSSSSALDLLGGNHRFMRRVHVALPEGTRESLRSVPPIDLVRSGLELMCLSLIHI